MSNWYNFQSHIPKILFAVLHNWFDLPQVVQFYRWPDGALKTKTCALLDGNRTLLLFGNEAEKKYEQLVKDGTHRDYFFFRLFHHDDDHISVLSSCALFEL